ncbi:MAG: DNA polymerase [Acidobacteria bacterium]|jgi:hypothetical protein|nr:DNA polymerase [Acidobacteriota bacterium]|tara:strand:+ start:443 stop:847 length:405 start_codon:yes stop_codon:yes gene_type:complete
MKFLDYWISMTQTKEDVMIDSPDPGAEKNYVPYNINKSLSSFWDYIHYVNEMNQLNHLDNKLQYDYFINTIEAYTGKNKRYAPEWLKVDEIEDLELIKEYYNYGSVKAKEALGLLGSEQLLHIKRKLRKGGMNK